MFLNFCAKIFDQMFVFACHKNKLSYVNDFLVKKQYYPFWFLCNQAKQALDILRILEHTRGYIHTTELN